jgi:hypothetical protein
MSSVCTRCIRIKLPLIQISGWSSWSCIVSSVWKLFLWSKHQDTHCGYPRKFADYSCLGRPAHRDCLDGAASSPRVSSELTILICVVLCLDTRNQLYIPKLLFVLCTWLCLHRINCRLFPQVNCTIADLKVIQKIALYVPAGDYPYFSAWIYFPSKIRACHFRFLEIVFYGQGKYAIIIILYFLYFLPNRTHQMQY